MSWTLVVFAVIGLVVVAITRPWRLWWRRRYCPQCRQLLPRWDFWGWREDWTCPRCGCQIGR